MSAGALQPPRMAARMAQSFHRLHAGPRFLQDFNMFRLIESYLGIVDEHGVTIPSDYRDWMAAVGEIERAVSIHALVATPCHNDLLCENFIDDGSALRIVDYELSGNNDPCFDLGNTAQEAEFDQDHRAALCEAYFGKPDPRQLARMNLFALMSDVGWTLWGAIQARISAVDYDFTGYYTGRWERALEVLRSVRLRRWMDVTDSELIRGLADRDTSALACLYDRYGGLAYSVALRVLGDSGLAEDTLQECFLKVWNTATAFDPQRGSLRTWLLTLVRNRAIDKLRGRRSRAAREIDLAAIEPLRATRSGSDPWEEVAFAAEQQAVSDGLARLPAEQRQAIELAYYGGYSHREIAQMTKVPLSTVKGRMRLALEKLHSYLEGKGLMDDH